MTFFLNFKQLFYELRITLHATCPSRYTSMNLPERLRFEKSDLWKTINHLYH